METTNTTAERRIDGKVRWMRRAGMLCALFAAVGIGDGIHQANPDGGWFMPVIAGLVAACALAIFWHIIIHTVTGMVRTAMIIALFVVAFIVTALSLGASAQAIATAISGQAALTAELSSDVDGFNQALAKAYAEATGWRGIAAAAITKATGYQAQAKGEEGGSHGTGKGCGPKCQSYKEFAGSFSDGATELNKMLEEAAAQRDAGEAQMSAMRSAAAHADQDGFTAAAEGVDNVIAKLNAVDPRPIIAQTGVVSASPKGIDLNAETKDFNVTAQKAYANRKQVEAPVFVPMSVGEATRHQMFGSALHGWILASVIDLLPLFFLILAFVMSREAWMNEQITSEDLTPEGKDGVDRNRLDSLLGRGAILPFKASWKTNADHRLMRS
jgi:hypothetical protein